jgi:hypothetical protein
VVNRPLAALLCLAACGAGPDDLFILDGFTTNTAGDGLPGVPVTLTRSFEGDCAGGKALHRTTSADAGHFSFDLVRIEVQALTAREAPTCLRASVGFPSGATAWCDLFSLPTQLTLPDLRDWEPQLSFSLDAGTPSFVPVLDGAPPAVCPGDFELQNQLMHGLVVRSGGKVLWVQSDKSSHPEVLDGGPGRRAYQDEPLRLPPEALEDLPGDVSIEARRLGCVGVGMSGVLGGAQPYSVVTRWSTPDRVSLPAGVRPVSRGATCAGFDGGACPLTDGDPTPVPLSLTRTSFRLKLAAPARVRVIVLRHALAQAFGLSAAHLSVKAGSDARTLELVDRPVALDESVYAERDFQLQLWRRIELTPRLELSADIELELDEPLVALGEISLFE